MTERILLLQYELLKLIQAQPEKAGRDESLDWERVHMASASRTAWLLALQRGIDPELPACAAALHDIGRILSGRQKNHAEAGYLPTQKFLGDTGAFSAEEIAVIANAVKNHSRKTEVGDPVEEIVKDADVIDCYQLGLPFDRPEKEARYRAWLHGNVYRADGREQASDR